MYYKRKIFFDPNKYYIFPSINAVKSLAENKQIYKFRNANILVIGLQVKRTLEKAGCKKIIATAKDSSSMLKTIYLLNLKNKNFIYLCSNFINEEFLISAIKKKIKIKKKLVYKTIVINTFSRKLYKYLNLNKISGVVFYSHLSARVFLDIARKKNIEINKNNLNCYCISRRVANPLINMNFKKIYVAKYPNEESIIASIKKS